MASGYLDEPFKDESRQLVQLIPALIGENYREWSQSMLMLLRQRGLVRYVEKPTLQIDTTWDEEKTAKFLARRDAALATVYLGIHPSHRGILEGVTDPDVAWTTLQNTYEPKSRAHIASLRNEFLTTRYEDGDNMMVFVARVENAVRRLKAAGKNVDDDEVAYHLINSLPPDYEGVVNTVYLWPDAEFTTQKVKGALFAQYGRLHERKKGEEDKKWDSAFPARGMSNDPRRKKYDPGKGKAWTTTGGAMQPGKTITCYGCKKPGHMIKDCPDKHQAHKKDSRRPGTYAGAFSGGFYIAAYQGEASTSKSQEEEFTLDTAATHHIIARQDLFSTYKRLTNASVKFGIKELPAIGIGTVDVWIESTHRLLRLNDALHVPALDRNLVSWSCLAMQGCEGCLKRDEIIIYDSKKALGAVAMLKKEFYIITGKKSEPASSSIARIETTRAVGRDLPDRSLMAWHRRLAHANTRVIKEMDRNDLVNGLDLQERLESKCAACSAAKMHRSTHKRIGKATASKPLELVHTDLWGPAPVTTSTGERFFVTYTDDYSRATTVYLLKDKRHVLDTFKDFVNRAERLTGQKLKRLRTDNGMEYCSKMFEAELSKMGVEHERTNTYSPQMNGTAERVNRTALEGIRAVLEESGMPKSNWGEILMAIIYLRNRIRHTTTGMIPITLWNGRKPSVKHTKRLGCLAFVYVPKVRRNKFEPRAKQGVLVGYARGTKGYRIWFPTEDTVVETIHVSFDESRNGMAEWHKSRGTVMQQPLWEASEHCTSPSDEEGPRNETEEQLLRTAPEATSSPVESTTTVALPHQLPPGWTRQVVERRTGSRKDVYFYPPTGERLRSRLDVETYCKDHGLGYEPGAFVWKADPTQNPPKDQDAGSGPLPPPDKPIGGAYHMELIVPSTFEEAIKSPQAAVWEEAMRQEFDLLEGHKVWTEIKMEAQPRALGTKWVYTIKRDTSGTIQRYKARLVALGHRQVEGLDYEDVYSPVVNFTVVRLCIMVFAVLLGWEVEQLDVTGAYLHGKIDKEVIMKIPSGYECKNRETTHLRLNHSLYGLHQSGKLWYQRLKEILDKAGFKPLDTTYCVFHKGRNAIPLFCVDDILLFTTTKKVKEKEIAVLQSIFDIRRLGPIQTYLGVRFNHLHEGVNMNQAHYIKKCVDRFLENAEISKSIPLNPGHKLQRCADQSLTTFPYRELHGSLSFLAQRTRPDISFAVNVLSQYCNEYDVCHWDALQQVLRYVNTTKSLNLHYDCEKRGNGLTAYVDADWGTNPDDRKSITGYVIFLYGHLLSWRTVKQKSVSLSTMEAEYIAISEVVKEIVWLTRIVNELAPYGLVCQIPVIYCDNQAAISYAKTDTENTRTRHIDLRYHFVKDLIERKELDIRHVSTKINLADLLTKALPRSRFEELRQSLLIPLNGEDTRERGEM